MRPLLGRRTATIGTLVLLLGFTVFLPAIVVLTAVVGVAISGDLRPLGGPGGMLAYAVPALAAMVFGALVFRRGAKMRVDARKMGAVDGWTLLAQDSRPPILYLRSFHDDEKIDYRPPSNVSAGGAVGAAFVGMIDGILGTAAGRAPTQEENLVRTLGRFGPVIAVGDPRDQLPDLGAARVHFDDTWQERVAELMAGARLVIFRIGTNSHGFWWEVERALRVAPAERVVFWIPPATDSVDHSRKIYSHFAALFAKRSRCAMPAWREDAAFLQFQPEWASATLVPVLHIDGTAATTPIGRRPPPSRKAAVAAVAAMAIATAVSWKTGGPATIWNRMMFGRASVPTSAPVAPTRTGAVEEARRALSALPPDLRSAPLLAQLAAQLNAQTPLMVDNDTELTSVASIQGMLIYNYRLVNHLAVEIEPAIITALKPRVARSACTTQSTKRVLDGGVFLRYAYYDRDRAPIAWFDVSSRDCSIAALPAQ